MPGEAVSVSTQTHIHTFNSGSGLLRRQQLCILCDSQCETLMLIEVEADGEYVFNLEEEIV